MIEEGCDCYACRRRLQPRLPAPPGSLQRDARQPAGHDPQPAPLPAPDAGPARGHRGRPPGRIRRRRSMLAAKQGRIEAGLRRGAGGEPARHRPASHAGHLADHARAPCSWHNPGSFYRSGKNRLLGPQLARNNYEPFHDRGVAQAAPAAGQAGQGGGGIGFLLMMVALFVLMYFMMIRPQMKRQKEHRAMVAALGKGDEVVTNGGDRRAHRRAGRVVRDGRDRRRREGQACSAARSPRCCPRAR